MDDIRQTAIARFRAYLERRQFSGHTVASSTLELRLFFAEVAVPLAQVSFREVDQFVDRQHHHGRAGRVPAGCGYCFGTSPHPSERGQLANDYHSKPIFKTPSTPLDLPLRTLSPSTRRSSIPAGL